MSETNTEETTEATEAPAPEAAEPDTPAPPEPTLTDNLVQAYQAMIESGDDTAYLRWGYALYHSLGDELVQSERVRLKAKVRDARDAYNLGCYHANREKYADAAKSFGQAKEFDPDLVEAWYNHALASELAGNIAEARKSWLNYTEICEDADEVKEVKNHLTELANR